MNKYKIDLPVSEKYHSYNNTISIDKNSENHLCKEVYKFAKYFKEELNYDRVPFSPSCMLQDEYKALLFTERAYDLFKKDPMPYRLYGVCLFTKIKFTDAEYWVLEWIWLHPFFRNRGNLKKNWKKLEEDFGNFLIREPISNDMDNFLKNTNSKYTHTIFP